jgi:hypothetical protein
MPPALAGHVFLAVPPLLATTQQGPEVAGLQPGRELRLWVSAYLGHILAFLFASCVIISKLLKPSESQPGSPTTNAPCVSLPVCSALGSRFLGRISGGWMS